MHRSSESIGAIAAALAKAQGELTNPEKSLTGTIANPGRPRGRPNLPLRAPVERPGYRSQKFGSARDCGRADDGHRHRGRLGPADHRAGARVGGMDFLGMAGLPGQ